MMLFDDELSPNEKGISDDDAFEMLGELERNTSDAIRRQRQHFRLDIKARVVVQPGNASDLLKFKMQGTTGDLSHGGCRALFPMPVRVGDIYRLSFDESALSIPLTFARCVRCLLLQEDAYEAGFSFFVPITLPEQLEQRVAQTAR